MGYWRKSSYSGGAGDCVEVWRKSSRCESELCVEVTTCNCDDHTVLVRDSKDPHGPILSFGLSQWKAFTDGIKNGEFDRR